MKKLITSLCFMVAFVAITSAQIKTPAPSPLCKVEQKVGLTDVTIEYSRPSVKKRTIFAADGLVPYGKMWRTGANASTKIEFSDDVKINGKELAKGKYAFYATPNAAEWEFVFYKNTSHWGVPREWSEEDVALRINAKPQALPMLIETMLITVGDITRESAVIDLLWENTMVGFTVSVDVDTKVMADIEKAMAGTTPGEYYTAASYYHDAGKDLKQALEWVRKATSVEKPKFWQVRREALILADMGNYKDAIKTAKKSIELAKAAGNADYVSNNEKSIAAWKAMK